MARTSSPARVYVVLESFSTTDTDGIPVVVRAGQTVEDGHPFLKLFPDNFRPFRPDFLAPDGEARWEQATAAPGEVR